MHLVAEIIFIFLIVYLTGSSSKVNRFSHLFHNRFHSRFNNIGNFPSRILFTDAVS